MCVCVCVQSFTDIYKAAKGLRQAGESLKTAGDAVSIVLWSAIEARDAALKRGCSDEEAYDEYNRVVEVLAALNKWLNV